MKETPDRAPSRAEALDLAVSHDESAGAELQVLHPDTSFEEYRPLWPRGSFLARSVALSAFAAVGEIRHFAPGTCLIEEGEQRSRVHLLLSACVKVTAQFDEHRHSLLGIRVGGDVVGELSAFDGMPPIATVRTCGQSPAVALVLERTAFSDVLVAHPQDAVLLNAAVAAKLRAATRRRVDFSGCSARVRLARALLEMAEDYGRRILGPEVVIGVNLTQVELGTLIGASEATAQRALRALRADGLLLTEGKRPIVRDLEALRRAARLP